MKRHLKNYLVPGDHNDHIPHLLKPKAIASISLTLLALKIVLGFVVFLVPSLAFASTGITTQDLLACTNRNRTERNLNKLVLNSELSRGAQSKLGDMDTYDYWAHVNPVNGTSPWLFFENIDYPYITAGENLAFSFKTSEGVCKGWMDSPTHRANLLDPTFQEVGFAVRDVDLGSNGRGILIVQFFGSRLDFYEEIEQKALLENCNLTIPGGPEILSPECGFINETRPEIKATAEEGKKLYFRINEQEYEGKVLEEGENRIVRLPEGYELPEGQNKIEAMLIEKNMEAAVTTVNVDTGSPFINEETLGVEAYIKDNKYMFDLTITITDDNLYKTFIMYQNENGEHRQMAMQLLGDDVYFAHFEFDPSQGEVFPITINALDKAENSSTLSVDLLPDKDNLHVVAGAKTINNQINLESIWRHLVAGFLVILFAVSVLSSILYKWKHENDEYLHHTAQTVILGILMMMSVYLLF
ncbi:CAP domain-containing protein [Patescibacteria group bacterium]